MEWDTAAGQTIALAFGGCIINRKLKNGCSTTKKFVEHPVFGEKVLITVQ